MVYTGGALNKLNGKSKVADPDQSVHVMSLIREHEPKSHAELEALIADHVGGAECCDVESGGTVEDFGRWLYEAQDEYWGERQFSLDECKQWEYDLFVVQSLKGRTMEDRAIELLEDRIGPASFEESSELVDEEYRIDIETMVDGRTVAGIQVKPLSYRKTRNGVQYRNREAHDAFGNDVVHLFYEYDSEDFVDVDEVVSELSAIVYDTRSEP